MYNVHTVTVMLWLLFFVLNKPYILRLCLKERNEQLLLTVAT